MPEKVPASRNQTSSNLMYVAPPQPRFGETAGRGVLVWAKLVNCWSIFITLTPVVASDIWWHNSLVSRFNLFSVVSKLSLKPLSHWHEVRHPELPEVS